MNHLLHLYWNFHQLFAEKVHASAKSSHHQSLDELDNSKKLLVALSGTHNEYTTYFFWSKVYDIFTYVKSSKEETTKYKGRNNCLKIFPHALPKRGAVSLHKSLDVNKYV